MAALVTNDEANKYMGTTGADYTDEIARASTQVETFLRRNVIVEPITEYHDGGGDSLFLTQFPVLAGSVTVTNRLGNEPVSNTDYFTDEKRGIIQHIHRWPEGFRIWKVEYQAGMAATVADVPGDIKKAVLMLIEAERSGGGAAEGIKKETIGDYSIEFFGGSEAPTQSPTARVEELLEPYRRRLVG